MDGYCQYKTVLKFLDLTDVPVGEGTAGSRSWREAAFWPGATSAVSTIKASGAPIAPGGGTTAAAPKTTASRGRLLRPVHELS